MSTRLAFYIGDRKSNPKSRIFDWLICWVTNSRFSHVEELCSVYQAPVNTLVNGVPYSGLLSLMLSSSIRDGGVREATRTLEPSRWVVVEFDQSAIESIMYIRSRLGNPYGLLDLMSFILPFRVSTFADFCSELIAAGHKISNAWKKSPNDLFLWAIVQKGAKIVSEEKLQEYWVAT